MTHIIDGKAFAEKIRQKLKTDIEKQKSSYNIQPALAVIIVGDDPASHVYVNNKEKSALEVGMKSIIHRIAETISQEELETIIHTLNEDKNIHGILVQMPLPKHLSEAKALAKINPLKDVDGFHTVNTGILHGDSAEMGLLPCTPHGCMILLNQFYQDLSGKHALVIGRSHIVGRPIAEMLLQKNATVTIAHSKTNNLPELCGNADIIIAAVGRPELIKGEWVKENAIIIDVGINRTTTSEGKIKLVGDVEFQIASKKAFAITPVPGGVGPMTIACLLQNTVIAAYLQNNYQDEAKNIYKI